MYTDIEQTHTAKHGPDANKPQVQQMLGVMRNQCKGAGGSNTEEQVKPMPVSGLVTKRLNFIKFCSIGIRVA